MKKILIVLLCLPSFIFAQFCGTSGYTTIVTTQAEVDALGGCTTFLGNLTIANQGANITNLDSLVNIQTIEGDFLIEEMQWQNIDIIMPSLTHINGFLRIYKCRANKLLMPALNSTNGNLSLDTWLGDSLNFESLTSTNNIYISRCGQEIQSNYNSFGVHTFNSLTSVNELRFEQCWGGKIIS